MTKSPQQLSGLIPNEPGSEINFWQSISAALSEIERIPLTFSKSDFAAPDSDIRFAVVRRFNYVVHFLIEPDEVQIVSVAHGARRPGYWLRRIKH